MTTARVGRCLSELAPLIFHMEALSARVIKGEEVAIRMAMELVGKVTEENIEHLPSIRACQKCVAPILVADILLSKRVVAISAFGFRRAGDRMALHDHPHIRGFIKCVRGSMKVRSFTSLEHGTTDLLKCRFEGQQLASPLTEVLQLAPDSGNIHEVVALEDGTFFFDVLYPGYFDNVECTYFTEDAEIVTKPGATTTLRRLPEAPSWQEMVSWRFPKLSAQ